MQNPRGVRRKCWSFFVQQPCRNEWHRTGFFWDFHCLDSMRTRVACCKMSLDWKWGGGGNAQNHTREEYGSCAWITVWWSSPSCSQRYAAMRQEVTISTSGWGENTRAGNVRTARGVFTGMVAGTCRRWGVRGSGRTGCRPCRRRGRRGPRTASRTGRSTPARRATPRRLRLRRPRAPGYRPLRRTAAGLPRPRPRLPGATPLPAECTVAPGARNLAQLGPGNPEQQRRGKKENNSIPEDKISIHQIPFHSFVLFFWATGTFGFSKRVMWFFAAVLMKISVWHNVLDVHNR